MAVFDIKLDEDGDLLIENGDFVLHESDETHIEHILLSNQGTWRQFPALGVGIPSKLLGPDSTVTRNSLAQLIRRNLVFDGFRIKKLQVQSLEEIVIDAVRI